MRNSTTKLTNRKRHAHTIKKERTTTHCEIAYPRRCQPLLYSLHGGVVSGSSHAREVGEIQNGRLLVQLRTTEVLGSKHQRDVEMLVRQLHGPSTVVEPETVQE